MDARETSINQEIHVVIGREVNLDFNDDGSLPDQITITTLPQEMMKIIQSRLLIEQYHHRFQLGMERDFFHPLQVVAMCGSTADF